MKNGTVKADYYDRITGALHKVGATVSVSDERAAELEAGGFIEVERERATPKPPARRTAAKKGA
ncbi:MAG: hypothetical protein Q4B35_06460 [Slackia sp.]|nr:hypothetical protein [Slackia sp.]